MIDTENVAREDLRAVYEIEDTEERAAGKAARLERLSADVAAIMQDEGLQPRHWLIGDIGNAHLVPIALYETWVPAFRQVFENCERDFDCLYAETKRLGGLPAEARSENLEALMN